MPQLPNIFVIRQKLLDVAHSDDILSLEEGRMISRITQDLDKYLQVIDEALQDGELGDNERLRIFSARMETMTAAVKQAKEDENISEDELAILKVLMHILNEMDEKLRKENLEKENQF